MNTPKVSIRVRDGLTVFTEVLFNGKQLPVTRVMFDTGDSQTSRDGLVFVSLTMLADLDIDIDGADLDLRDVRITNDPMKLEADLTTVGEYGFIQPKVRPDRRTIERILHRWRAKSAVE